MTTENTIPEVTQDEVKNPAALIAKNKELLAKLKAAQDDLATAQASLEVAKSDSENWRKQWHDVAVIAPLDARLEDASVGLAKYLRAELLERGILKMEIDDSGIDRPAWYKDGVLSMPTDLHQFLTDMNDPELNRMVRAGTASGGGATSSKARTISRPPAEPAMVVPHTFGLR